MILYPFSQHPAIPITAALLMLLQTSSCSNDAADPLPLATTPSTITGDNTGTITEDDNPDADNLLDTSGKLEITDQNTSEDIFNAEEVSGSYGNLVIDSAGNWIYSASNSQSEIQSLASNTELTDSLTISSIDGTEQVITITLVGADDAAIFSGSDSGDITEDNTSTGSNLLLASGKLQISDQDTGEASFVSTTVAGNYGSLVIDADGNWNYSASNDQADIQALINGTTLTDSLPVSSVAGEIHHVTITFNGVNDIAVISGTNTGGLTEDLNADINNQLKTSGQLIISDPDAAEALFMAAETSGSYGSFVIDSTGNWDYSADNTQPAIQGLAKDAESTDSFTVSSADGTTLTITITLTGTDDAAIITGANTGSVTEDNVFAGTNLLVAAGSLSITDNDSGEAAFTAATINGLFGNITIDASGNWRYSASNDQSDIQALANGATLTENLTVTSVDGTTHPVTITINSLDISLSWTAPVLREDGSSILLSEISGYRIYYGTAPGDYQNDISTVDASTLEHTFKTLPLGNTYYFVVTTVDTGERESLYSSEISISN